MLIAYRDGNGSVGQYVVTHNNEITAQCLAILNALLSDLQISSSATMAFMFIDDIRNCSLIHAVCLIITAGC